MNFKRLMTIFGAVILVGIIALSWGCQNHPTGPVFEDINSGKERPSSWWGGSWSTTTASATTSTTTSGGSTTTAGSWWGGGSWYGGGGSTTTAASTTTTSGSGWYVGTSTTSGGYTTTTTSGGGGGGGWYGDIIVRARGTGGGEHIYVTVGGSQIADFNLTTSYQNYSASTSNTGEIQVCFDNDDGENMDVQIDYIEVDGERRQAEDQQSNTGVWQNSSCGGEYSEMLHCEGCINFGSVSGGSSATTTSGGYTTTTNGGYTTTTAASTTTTFGWGGGWWSSTTTTNSGSTTTSGGSTQIDGNQVLIIGNSFIANSHDITGDLEQMARDAGILAYGDNFIDNSVNSAQLSGGPVTTIPQQYANGNSQRRIRWVIMSGGGNDCVRDGCNPATTSCSNLQNAVNALRDLLSDMRSDGVIKVIYFFYPDPQLDEPEQTQLKGQLDVLRPMIQDVVNSSSSPVCYWLDLRPVFQGHYNEYVLSDGLHPSAAGSRATAEAIWNIVEQNNFFSGN